MLAEMGCCVFVEDKTPQAIARAIKACLSEPERYRRISMDALRAAKPFTLERWRDDIRSALESAWGPLQSGAVGGGYVDERLRAKATTT
jgi:hypothetical protein